MSPETGSGFRPPQTEGYKAPGRNEALTEEKKRDAYNAAYKDYKTGNLTDGFIRTVEEHGDATALREIRNILLKYHREFGDGSKLDFSKAPTPETRAN